MQHNFEITKELECQLGEWLTYCSISKYNQRLQSYGEFELDLSDEAMFETRHMSSGFTGVFGDTYHFMERMGLIYSDSQVYHAKCLYSEIPTRIRGRIKKSQPPVIFTFIGVLNQWFDCFGKSERDYVLIEPACEPMFTKLVNEGFCLRVDNRYYWTKIFRPYFESSGIWNPAGKKSRFWREEFLFESLNNDLVDRLIALAETNQKILAIKLLIDETDASLKDAKSCLEKFMFPKVWDQNSGSDEKLFKWYGAS